MPATRAQVTLAFDWLAFAVKLVTLSFDWLAFAVKLVTLSFDCLAFAVKLVTLKNYGHPKKNIGTCPNFSSPCKSCLNTKRAILAGMVSTIL